MDTLFRALARFFEKENPETIRTDLLVFLETCAELGLIDID